MPIFPFFDGRTIIDPTNSAVGMLITSTEQLTPDHLTDLLRTRGSLDRGRVARIDVKLTKRLHVSVVSRLEVGYSADSGDSAPRNLLLKMSGSDAMGNAEHSEKEVEFYLKVASNMPGPPLIRCYDAVFSAETQNYHLLLEDLSDTHFQPETPAPPSRKMSRSAVESLAELHAYWWEHPQLGSEIGELFDQNELQSFVGEVEKNIAGFIDFLGDKLSPRRRRIYDQLIAKRLEVWGRLTDPRGLTVTHGDTHWWNFLYPHDQRNRVRIFDWQLWHVDVGARDLAFLVAVGGFADRRPEIEHDLIDCYFDSLVRGGVSGYSRDHLWDDYRWAALRNLNIPVIFWSQGRDEALWSSLLDRAIASFEDLKCSELLGD